MLKTIITFCVLLVSALANAQNHRPFQLTVGGGVLSVFAEPAIRVTDYITLGVKYEANILIIEADNYHESLPSGIEHLSANLRLYVSQPGPVRSYLGAGIGRYDTSFGFSSHTQLGWYPRLGFDIFRVHLDFEYHVVPENNYDGHSGPHWQVANLPQNNLFLVHFGIRLGGGRKNTDLSWWKR